MSRKKTVITFIAVFLVGVVFAGAFNLGVSATNTLEFCTSCHSMSYPYDEYKASAHFINPSGVRAICADCHVPHEFGPKMVAKVLAYKDVLHEILGTIDTKEKYEQHRWAMANRVWDKMKATNSRECRSCHSLAQMDLSAQTRSARNRHSRAEDEGQTCIDCHKGVAHQEPTEPAAADGAPAAAGAAAESTSAAAEPPSPAKAAE